MEEATELFAIQQQLVIRANLPPPTPSTVGSSAPRPPPPPPGSTLPTIDQDMFWVGLPALAAAAGIFAAMLKRSQEPPRAPDSSAKEAPTP
jgi:hypothetical protein